MRKKIIIITLLMTIFCLSSKSQTQLKKVYNEDINPIEQIDEAIKKAIDEDKYVVCQVGGNWCPWCLRFADFIENDTDISEMINDNFVYIHVNYNPRRTEDGAKEAIARELMQRLNNAGRFGYPVFVVLNEKGDVIHIQDSSFLEEGKGYDKEKTMRFFKNWTPKAVKQETK